MDPTASEMREFLHGQFDDLNIFDREEAIYWFAYAWHGGQGSNLYSALSTSDYSPGPICCGPEDATHLTALEAEYSIP